MSIMMTTKESTSCMRRRERFQPKPEVALESEIPSSLSLLLTIRFLLTPLLPSSISGIPVWFLCVSWWCSHGVNNVLHHLYLCIRIHAISFFRQSLPAVSISHSLLIPTRKVLGCFFFFFFIRQPHHIPSLPDLWITVPLPAFRVVDGLLLLFCTYLSMGCACVSCIFFSEVPAYTSSTHVCNKPLQKKTSNRRPNRQMHNYKFFFSVLFDLWISFDILFYSFAFPLPFSRLPARLINFILSAQPSVICEVL